MALSDLQSMAREEGEGMETTETENPSPAVTPLPSLEHLLTSPDPKQGMFKIIAVHCAPVNNSHTESSVSGHIQTSAACFKTLLTFATLAVR